MHRLFAASSERFGSSQHCFPLVSSKQLQSTRHAQTTMHAVAVVHSPARPSTHPTAAELPPACWAAAVKTLFHCIHLPICSCLLAMLVPGTPPDHTIGWRVCPTLPAFSPNAEARGGTRPRSPQQPCGRCGPRLHRPEDLHSHRPDRAGKVGTGQRGRGGGRAGVVVLMVVWSREDRVGTRLAADTSCWGPWGWRLRAIEEQSGCLSSTHDAGTV